MEEVSARVYPEHERRAASSSSSSSESSSEEHEEEEVEQMRYDENNNDRVTGSNNSTTLIEAETAQNIGANNPTERLTSIETRAVTHKFWWLRHYHLSELASAAVAEFIGTFFFVLTVPLSSMQHAEMAPISIGFTFLSLEFAFGYLSGGHMNPMVSLSIWLCTAKANNKQTNFGKRRLVIYIIAQMLGGTAATFFCMLINGRVFPVPNMGLDFIHMLRGFFAESAYTFLLCSVVLHVAVSRQRNNNFAAFSIGFTIVCGGLTCGSISGGVFNPAIATPLIVLRCLFSFDNAGCTPMASLWVYWASEMLGAIMASVTYLALQNIDE